MLGRRADNGLLKGEDGPRKRPVGDQEENLRPAPRRMSHDRAPQDSRRGGARAGEEHERDCCLEELSVLRVDKEVVHREPVGPVAEVQEKQLLLLGEKEDIPRENEDEDLRGPVVQTSILAHDV
jgi:hypothetical protein